MLGPFEYLLLNRMHSILVVDARTPLLAYSVNLPGRDHFFCQCPSIFIAGLNKVVEFGVIP